MTIELGAALGLGLFAGLGIAVPPGAVSVLVVQEAIRDARSGVAAALGVAIVDTAACALALAGGALVASSLNALGDWPAVIGGVVLFTVGVLGLRPAVLAPSPVPVPVPVPIRPAATIGRFIAITASNPATLLYFLAFAVATRTASLLFAVIVIAAAGVASLTWQLVLVVIGHLLGRMLGPGMRQALRVLGALVVMTLGISVVVGAVAG